MRKKNVVSFIKKNLDLRVRSQNTNKPAIYLIVNLGLPASTQELEWISKGRRMITVENYYREHHGIILQ